MLVSGIAATREVAICGNWASYDKTVARSAEGGRSVGGIDWEEVPEGKVWKRVGFALSVVRRKHTLVRVG